MQIGVPKELDSYMLAWMGISEVIEQLIMTLPVGN